MNIKRRIFLKYSVLTGTLFTLGSVFLKAKPALAAWPEEAFNANSIDTALSALNIGSVVESKDITINTPKTVENGAFVPLSIQANIENVSRISIFVEQSEQPLVGSYDIANNIDPYISTRIKMSKTSNVLALVQANEKNYIARKSVTILHSDC